MIIKSLNEAFAPVEAVNRSIVMFDTWGHLAPEPGKKYTGYIIVAVGCSGDNIIFDYNFTDLEGGPWLFEDICDFALFKQDFPHREPALYRLNGWYKKFKNGNYQFGGGKFEKIDCQTEV